MTLNRAIRVFVPSAGIIILLLAPVLTGSVYIHHLLIVAMMYAVIASNWDLSLGYGGVFNFGHLAFFAVGAYAAGIATKTFGWDAWWGIPAGAIVAVIAGALVSLPVLRLKGIYVVLITFAFGQLCLHLVLGLPGLTGGSQGMVLLPPLTIGKLNFAFNAKLGSYYLAVVLFAASTIFLRRLVTSSFGKAIIALKDNEDYAMSRGISLARQRILTFMGSALFTGAIGGFYALYLQVVSPEVFSFGFLSLSLSMLLLGGVSTVYGPIVAAFGLTFLSEALANLGAWRLVIVAVIILLVLRFLPNGIASAFNLRTQPPNAHASAGYADATQEATPRERT